MPVINISAKDLVLKTKIPIARAWLEAKITETILKITEYVKKILHGRVTGRTTY